MSTEQWGRDARLHVEAVHERNAATLEVVARILLRTITDDGLIHTAGSGHSLGLVLDTFYRSGGLACVQPIYHPSLFPLEGARASTLMERTSGIAQTLIAAVDASARDTAIIFSNSGANPVPIELAEALRTRGATVVAMTSLSHADIAFPGTGNRLAAVVDHVIDTMVPYGDASYPSDAPTVAPLSSWTCIYLWNVLLVRLAELAFEAGIDLPVWASVNTVDGDHRNQALFDRYQPRIAAL
ncbi:MAG TPA: sugar isomerase domain-containing protein [Acidimicrobiia bacterium]|nr:sugar isomerase domain-containing protein [Acidimicrobiia bacterium]